MKFEYADKAPLVLVETRLNSKGPFRFVVDTASSVTVVGRQAAETIGISQNSDSITSDCCSSKMLAVGSVQIGETSRSRVPIVLGDLSKLSQETGTRLDGIIGSPFMKNFEVTIDYPHKEVAFQEPREKRRLPTKFVTVNDAGFVVVDAELNGKGPYNFLVDTGATKTAVAKHVRQALGLYAMNQKRKALSGFFAGATMTLSKVKSICVGKAKSAEVEVGVQDLQPLSSGIGIRLDGILGYTFMKDYRVTINYPEQALSFERDECPNRYQRSLGGEARMKQKEIKNYVKKRYGEVAQLRTASCCGSTTARARDIGYSKEDLKSIPESSNMGLGCGNPVALASLKEGETVLDLGSGGGIDVFLAAKRVGPKGKVIGVDMTEEMISKARKAALKNGWKNVEFRLGDIEDLPVEDGSVDVVISNCVINLAPDKAEVFREAYRVLKPSGRIMVSDIVTEGKLSEKTRKNLASWAGCVAGALEKDQYLSLMKKAGFRNVAIVSERTSSDCCSETRIASVQVQGFRT